MIGCHAKQKAFIKKISFIGDKKIKDSKLRKIIVSEEAKFWKFVSSRKFLDINRIELDTKLLLNHYKNKGYYMNKNPIGNKGDFITSPNISIMFSEMIAIWILGFWENLGNPKKINLVELGAGNGEMMKILLETFKKFPVFFDSCNILIHEKSIKLKKIQKINL